MNIISTDKLTKFYNENCALKDLDLEVKKGEILGFIGPNGAGKSTAVRTLLSLIYPTSGSATIFDKDIIKYGPEIKNDIGYLPSEVFYYDNMRAIDLLNYSAGFYKKDCSKKIAELAETLKLDLNKKIEDLSYGNKKKVGIIQGLLHSPKLIILDEPTGGLDPLMQQKFYDILKNENKKGATIFFSSHVLSEVQKLCDRVAIIKDGKLVKIESMKDLAKNNYKRFKLFPKNMIDKSVFNINGVKNLKISKKEIEFIYRGDINIINAKILGLDLMDLRIDEPDLEEIFMHYYK